jgi:hypothetical protein
MNEIYPEPQQQCQERNNDMLNSKQSRKELGHLKKEVTICMHGVTIPARSSGSGLSE